jgi:hypothetical protein
MEAVVTMAMLLRRFDFTLVSSACCYYLLLIAHTNAHSCSAQADSGLYVTITSMLLSMLCVVQLCSVYSMQTRSIAIDIKISETVHAVCFA